MRRSVRRGRRTVSCGATHIALEGLRFIADGVGGGALVPRDKVSVEVRHGLSERDRIHAQAAGEFELLLLDVPDSEAFGAFSTLLQQALASGDSDGLTAAARVLGRLARVRGSMAGTGDAFASAPQL